MPQDARIRTLTIRGFRSIRILEDYSPGPLDILVGANGAGKSNFIAFFRLMSWMMQEKLAFHVGVKGAGKLLYDGPKTTRSIRAHLTIDTQAGANEYAFELFHTPGRDEFVFSEEKFRFTRIGWPQNNWTDLGAGHKETRLAETADNGNVTARVILSLLRGCWVHQFHNTSDSARFKEKWLVKDGWSLKEDAGNLAPFLLKMREGAPNNYRQVVAHCRRVLPFFDDFVLIPDNDYVLLQWKEKESDVIFDAADASDGMLRVFALLALLCQPEDQFPEVLMLDEPELGLHPAAIELVAGLMKSASVHTQIIAATQSAPLLDQFAPEEVTVAERHGRETILKRLSSEALAGWLEEYTLADLWQKNVIGGRPNQ